VRAEGTSAKWLWSGAVCEFSKDRLAKDRAESVTIPNAFLTQVPSNTRMKKPAASRLPHVSLDLCELAPSYIRSIAPYQPGKPISELERELGIKNAVKLASNENPLGPSPLAIAAAREALNDVSRYPDGNGFELKAALAARYRVAMDNIVLGNGSNDVLELLARAYLFPGEAAAYSQHAFAVYPLVTQATGAQGIEVPARDYGHDLQAIAKAVTRRTRIVFLANPNNPTGTLIAKEELLDFLRSLPAGVLVALDEAYYEYLPDKLKSGSVDWLAEFPNLVVTRTFSKAYGLAGLRVGFALCSPTVADMMNRVRQPFNVNSIALDAAQAALADTEFVARSVRLNSEGLQQISSGLRDLGLSFIPSYANFVSFELPNAEAVYQKLLRRGVIVRPIANYGMPNHLRVSIGLEDENTQFLRALERSL
jgi:histidinol-phosphate aminotransferase